MFMKFIQRFNLFQKSQFIIRKKFNLQHFSKQNKKMNFVLRRPEGLASSKPEWVLVEADYDYCNEIARAAYADMLHDHDRNEKYYTALKQVIRDFKSRGEKSIVLDIGTGTGLLSMMAVRAGADEVYACESFLPMLECAKKVTKRNKASKQIKLIPKRSTDLKIGVDLPYRCNILVTEVFDTELIGEHAIQTYNHASRELLVPNYVPIPFSAKVFLQLVNSPTIEKFNTLPEQISSFKVPETKHCVGVNSVQDIQLSQLREGDDFENVLGPLVAFEFDFSKPLGHSRSVKIDTENYQFFNYAFLYWTLDMTNKPETTEVITCETQFISGNKYYWREHWIQLAYYIPPDLRQDLTLFHDEFSFNFGRNLCLCGMHTRLARTRMFEINTTDYNKYLEIDNANVKQNCVVLSDNTILPFLIKNRYKKVKLLSDENVFNFESDIFDDNFVVIGDPYFSNSLSCIDNLQFFHKVSQLDNVQNVFPMEGTVYCIFVEFKDLWKVKGRVGSTCGFDLTDFDALIELSITKVDPLIEPHPIWQYEYKLVSSSPTKLFSITHKTQNLEFSKHFHLENKSNGLIFYVDYSFGDFDVKSFDDNKFSKSRNQSVMFLLENCKDYHLNCTFNFETGFRVVSIKS